MRLRNINIDELSNLNKSNPNTFSKNFMRRSYQNDSELIGKTHFVWNRMSLCSIYLDKFTNSSISVWFYLYIMSTFNLTNVTLLFSLCILNFMIFKIFCFNLHHYIQKLFIHKYSLLDKSSLVIMVIFIREENPSNIVSGFRSPSV